MELEKDKRGGTTVTCNTGEVKVVEKGNFLRDHDLTVWYHKRFYVGFYSSSTELRSPDYETQGSLYSNMFPKVVWDGVIFKLYLAITLV